MAERDMIDLPPIIKQFNLNDQEAYAAGLLEQQKCRARFAARKAAEQQPNTCVSLPVVQNGGDLTDG